MSYMVEVERGFTVMGAGADNLHDTAELVMAELVKLTSEEGPVLDAAVSADSSGSTEEVIITVTVKAPDLASGEAEALSAMRAAIHTVGGVIPEWADKDDGMTMVGRASRAELVGG